MQRKKTITKDICQPTIYSVSAEDYGNSYGDHLIDQYHRYIESLWYIGNLKQKVNSYFLSINTILLAALGISFSGISSSAFSFEILGNGPFRLVIPFVGIVLCVVWWSIIYSYKQKQYMKLTIIRCIEDKLPLAPYSTEDEVIQKKFQGAHFYVFKMSLLVPWIFILLYFVIELLLL